MSSVKTKGKGKGDANFDVSIEKVTPEIAREWLDLNTENFRKLNKKTVTKYAKDMSAGNWDLSDTCVSFNPDGVLVNGQHRLHAVIESGASIYSLVFWGYKGLLTCDSGVSRKLTDWLAFVGEKNSSSISAILRKLYTYIKMKRFVPYKSFTHDVSNDELIKLLDDHPAIRKSASFCNSVKVKGLASSIIGLVHYLAWGEGEVVEYEEFIRSMRRCKNLIEFERDDPRYKLLKALEENRKKVGTRYGPPILLILLTRAWFFYRQGKKANRLLGTQLERPFPWVFQDAPPDYDQGAKDGYSDVTKVKRLRHEGIELLKQRSFL